MDFCANAIVSLMLSPATCLTRTYHLTSPVPLPFTHLATALAPSQSGITLASLSYDEWIEKVRDEAARKGDKFPLTALLSYFDHGFPRGLNAPCDQTYADLASIGVQFPEITGEIVARYGKFYTDTGNVYSD